MSTPARKELTDDLFDLMNGAWRDDGTVLPLDLKRVKREFSKVESKILEPALLLGLKGMLACMEKEFESMHTFHKRAIELSPDIDFVINYSASLARAGLFHQAIILLKEHYDTDHSQRLCLIDLINMMFGVGYVKLGFEYSKQLNSEELDRLLIDPQAFNEELNIIEQYQISDKEIDLYGQAVDSVIEKNKTVTSRRRVNSVMVPDDNSFLELLIYIKDSADAAVSLGVEMCEKLASLPPLENMTSRVSVRFIPL